MLANRAILGAFVARVDGAHVVRQTQLDTRYLSALCKAALARKATEAAPADPEPVPVKANRRSKGAITVEGDAA